MRSEVLSLFPYKMRPIQVEMVDRMDRAMDRKGHIAIEAGTGSGKTVSSLAPALFHAYRDRKRVLYLTRTNSQQRQVVEEYRRIRSCPAGSVPEPPSAPTEDVVEDILKELNGERSVRSPACIAPQSVPMSGPWEGGPGKGLCSAIQGRANMCPLASDDPEFLSGTPDELSRMCGERKRVTLARMSGKPVHGNECRFYSAFLLDDGAEARSWARGCSPTAEEMAQKCLSIGTCPYETTKRMVSDSVLVTAPYIFFLSPFIRRRLLEWMGCGLEDLIVIFDEAHNVAQFARELCSLSISLISLRLASSEASTFGDKNAGAFTVSLLIDALSGALQTVAEEFLIDEDGTVPPTSLMDTLMVQLRSNSSQLERAFSEMLQYGISIQDTRRAQGRLPRSYIHRAAQFFLAWNELDFTSYSPLIVKGQRPGELYLEAFAMDPSQVTGDLVKVHSSVHLSGTLSPLEEYRDTLGLPGDTELLRLPPPFPPENRMITYTQDLCTSYEMLRKDPEMRTKYRERVLGLLDKCRDRNTALFFPSFDLMGEVLGLQELEDGTTLPGSPISGRPVYIERRGSSQSEVMDLVDEFRTSEGAVLCSVMGGRLSEGMDYPGRSLELVLVVGVPYPKPNARQRSLSSFYDIRFGKGWEYTVHAPAARKMLQAVGRMIRSEKERGFSVIMDRRAVHFREELGELSVLDPELNAPVRFFTWKD
ncbi:MAG: ATP-dependent DNA helicase [Candidatus Thermoplasmatota archaeon]|jgi:DNA excision repair protein ERCC-2|nr:ATP-dependent DNA helicase [Candidatus Thermoplasmatota archaeon]